jgi:hypothetical protein
MWVLNIWLYLCFMFNPPVYDAFVQAGAPCMVYISDHGEAPEGPPPACFYVEQ